MKEITHNKCEKCFKYSVCKLSTEYKKEIEQIKNVKKDNDFEAHLICNEYFPKNFDYMLKPEYCKVNSYEI